MTVIQYSRYSKWPFSKMTVIQNDRYPKWPLSKITGYQNDRYPKWPFAKITVIQNDRYPKRPLSKMTVHQNYRYSKWPFTKITVIQNDRSPKLPLFKMTVIQNDRYDPNPYFEMTFVGPKWPFFNFTNNGFFKMITVSQYLGNGHLGNGYFDNGHFGNGHFGIGHFGNCHFEIGHFGEGHFGNGNFGRKGTVRSRLPDFLKISPSGSRSIPDCDLSLTHPSLIWVILNLMKSRVNYFELIQTNAQLTFGWEPIPRDGTFFTSDAIEKYKNGDLQSTVPLVTGSNSFEGSLVQATLEMPGDLR